MEAMWEESDICTPMICLLSMGSDPTASIEALSKRKSLSKYQACTCYEAICLFDTAVLVSVVHPLISLLKKPLDLGHVLTGYNKICVPKSYNPKPRFDLFLSAPLNHALQAKLVGFSAFLTFIT